MITFCSIVESVEDAEEKREKGEQDDFDKMVEIPAGTFLYEDDKKKESIEKTFFIDVYPVTNQQFKRFIEEGGYAKEEFWNEEGREWREKTNAAQPKYWDDEKWNPPDFPVVGLTFYEAQAYTRWRSDRDGKEYRLPTEKEWEKAARGTDGLKYPWGDEFDKDRCNSMESGFKRTSRVTRYPNGISPYGCYDMAGNVWEWTQGSVLRGGSWTCGC